MENILLLGAGALARDLIDVFDRAHFVAAFVDPQFAVASHVDTVPVVCDWRAAVACATHFVLAVSDITHRQRLCASAVQHGLVPASPLVSDMARIAHTAELSPGCIVSHFAAVGSGAKLGAHGLVMHNTVVGHDSTIAENVVVCAGVCIAGYASIGANSFIGTNAVLSPKVSLGEQCLVAAGAACLRDAPAQSFLVGNPARRTVRP